MPNSYRKIEVFNLGKLHQIRQLKHLPKDLIEGIRTSALIFPFKTNNYVVNELIDWDQSPDDPIFRLNFPHPDMLRKEHWDMLTKVKGTDGLTQAVKSIRMQLNPNPASQMSNVPFFENVPVKGLQHKYPETALIFPSQGQVCHAYCTFCFRWPQFIGESDLRFATDECRRYQRYISEHTEITDVLLTGGDPMVMNAGLLSKYIEPFLQPEFEHIRCIRIGSKSLSYWPMRFISDPDAQQVLALFEKVVSAGKHLAFQAHFNHWRELATPAAEQAIKNIQATGAVIRSQSPLLNHINNDWEVWHEMWMRQCNFGIVPYYMFVARNTGAHDYFAVTLAHAYKLFTKVYRRLSGLGKTVRGPSMSTTQGKVKIDGVRRISGLKVFILKYLESRNPHWINRPFFAKFDETATWMDELEPAFDSDREYFSQNDHDDFAH